MFVSLRLLLVDVFLDSTIEEGCLHIKMSGGSCTLGGDGLMIRIVLYLAIGANVSLKSLPSLCSKPRATTRA